MWKCFVGAFLHPSWERIPTDTSDALYDICDSIFRSFTPELGLSVGQQLCDIAEGSVAWDTVKAIRHNILKYLITFLSVFPFFPQPVFPICVTTTAWDSENLSLLYYLSLFFPNCSSDQYISSRGVLGSRLVLSNLNRCLAIALGLFIAFYNFLTPLPVFLIGFSILIPLDL